MSIEIERENQYEAEPDFQTWYDGEGAPLKLMVFKGKAIPCKPNFPSIKDSMKKRHSFEPRNDDVWISTYAKSGTHWANDIAKMILRQSAEKIDEPMTGLEFASPEELKQLPSPRVLCTHVGYHDMPREVMSQGSKIIYISRNPKDIAVSAYNHKKGMTNIGYSGTFKGYFTLFMNTMLPNWFSDVLEWVKMGRDQKNILFLTYEDMIRDLPKRVKEIADFLEKPIDDDLCAKIADACSLKSMKRKRVMSEHFKTDSPGFIRKGKVGDWKNWFTVSQNEKFDKVFEEKMKGVDFKVEFELSDNENDGVER